MCSLAEFYGWERNIKKYKILSSENNDGGAKNPEHQQSALTGGRESTEGKDTNHRISTTTANCE